MNARIRDCLRGLLIGGGVVFAGLGAVFGDRPWTPTLLILSGLFAASAEWLPAGHVLKKVKPLVGTVQKR